MILLEDFDTCREAIIEPVQVAAPIPGFPRRAVTCYSSKLLSRALDGREHETICTLDTEDGGVPVYRIRCGEEDVAVYMSRVGAPASAVQFEEMIAHGADRFVMFGSCGVLVGNLGKWHTIIPTAAFRDEGTSYHYLPASEEVEAQEDCVRLLCRTFEEWGEIYVCGKTWTTDAIYRETKEKTEKRRNQGCIAVEMECASVQAVAKFRGVRLAQFFYAEDSLEEPVWNPRGLSKNIQTEAERIFGAALACALKL